MTDDEAKARDAERRLLGYWGHIFNLCTCGHVQMVHALYDPLSGLPTLTGPCQAKTPCPCTAFADTGERKS
jgi:hypothetical protein